MKKIIYDLGTVFLCSLEGRLQVLRRDTPEFPETESGYYWVHIGDRDAQVYCDMKNYGEYMISF